MFLGLIPSDARCLGCYLGPAFWRERLRPGRPANLPPKPSKGYGGGVFGASRRLFEYPTGDQYWVCRS